MKANEFIKTEGLNKAKYALKNNPDLLNLPFFKRLKELVESHELVEAFFNLNYHGLTKCLEMARKDIKELEESGVTQFQHKYDDDLSCTVERMKQALSDIESCGGECG
ncbi:hypothetical protein [Acinetobacter gerneri]|jgi:predicted amidohydrolase|uniref:hypothetical protein n=1 Tax=Acinetobacter gerneri TaxID=202952 RepID=UPI0023F3B102|nr:hypothetical protein [Acinetobacter gerneri]MCH4243729.1 hypothetical protein [Acinetobacter gerneri]